MITRKVRLQLAAFALLSVALVAVLSAGYVGLTDRLLGGSYRVSADFAQSGGIFVGAEVTYRGVTVGKVEGLRLSKDGVIVDARLDRGTQVPKDARAVVENRSAVGEQYLDLQPQGSGQPYLRAGDTIPRDRTAYPIRVDQLLQHINNTVASVPKAALVTTIDELGRAFQEGGADLQRLIDSGDSLTAAATEALPETTKLIDDGRIVLDTQVRSGKDIRTSVKGFADVADALATADPDLRLVLDRGTVAVKELDGLIMDNKQNIAALLANLITIGNVTTTHVDGIEQMLVTYPDVVVGGYTVVPGDGTAHFGLVLNADDPKACEQGYGGTRKTDPHQTTNLPPVNTGAHCAAPRGSGINVRGAQNAPHAGSGGTQSYPMSYGAQPVPLGMAGAAVNPAARTVSAPAGPADATGAQRWLWMMQGALQ